MSRMVEPPAVDPVAADFLTATHESGHAVVRLVRGLPVGLIAVCDPIDTGGALGFCAVTSDYSGVLNYLSARQLEPPVAPEKNLIEHLLALLAGGVAESSARGVDYSPASPGAWRDRFDAEWLVGDVLRRAPYSAGVRGFLHAIEVVAAADVCKHWTWIEVVARELVTARRLTGDQIVALRPGAGK
jgi:hypothetical protein